GTPHEPSADTTGAFSLDGLVVTAAPTTLEEDAVTRHVTVLGAEELRRFGDRSLAEALRDVAGIHAVRGGSFGAVTSLFLRGGESDYTLVMVDGVQVNQAGGGFDFAELTTDAVERVEIVRGPASALYGSDAVTGVIHVITRTGTGAPVTNLSFGAGSFGRRDLSADLRAGSGRASYGVALTRRTTNGIFELNNESSILALSGTGRFQPDARTRLEVNLRASDREYHFPTNSAGAVVDENAFTFSDGVTARVSALRQLTSRLSVEATVGMNQMDGGTEDAVDGPADTVGFYGFTSLDHFRRSVGEVRGHLRLDEATLTGGFEYEEERQRSFTESLSEFGPSSARSSSRRENLGYFAHATGALSGVTYQLGARLEDNERFGTSATWQVGFASPTPWSRDGVFRASVGTAIKEPTFFETFATGFARGNPDLDPERSLAWEVGLEERIGGFLTVGGTFFDQRFRDLIQYTFAPPAPDDPNYFNVAAARARGLELDVDVRRGPWSGGATWSWVDTEVTDSGFDDGPGATFVEGEPLLRRPTWTGSVHGAVQLGHVDLSARLRHVGSRHDRDFSTFPATPVTLDAFQLLSASADVVVVDGSAGGLSLAVEVRGENLLDTSYTELFGFPAPGRGLYLGGRVTLGR
ncbi:MAG: TonB-dependent receptor, partial [Longimicrobiales bacterium]|nr:TonB-dependent receptor [Longimicrobiales bacterium]